MKKYDVYEVIELHEEYMEKEYGKYYPEDAVDLSLSFREWLKDKEQLETPVKGQMIWVRENYEESEWCYREFHHIDESGRIHCYTEDRWLDDELMLWDEYSLTDPNQ